MLRKILFALLFTALLPCMAHASGYNTQTTGINYFDNTPNFTLHNAWRIVPSTPQLSQFTSNLNADGTFTFRGLDPAHNVWGYTESQDAAGFHSSWVQHPEMGTDNGQLALGFGKIYKLTASTNCHTSGEYTVYKWSGTAWVYPVTAESCSMQISVGDQDGTLASRTNAGHLYVLDPGTTAWVQLTGGASTYQSVAVAGQYMVFANDSAGNIYQRTAGANTLYPSPFVKTPEATGTLVTDGGEQLWFKSASGKAYIYRAGAWVTPLGPTVSQLSTSAPMHTFAVVGTSLYRFAEYGLQWSIAVTGSFANCPPQGCPPGSAHTPTADIEFADGSTGHAHAAGNTVNALSEVYASATAGSWDPFRCIWSGFDFSVCLNTMSSGGAVTCAVMGQIYGQGFSGGFPPVSLIPIPQEELCQGTFKKTGKIGGSCHGSGAFETCDYTAVAYCGLAATPMDDWPLGFIGTVDINDMLMGLADIDGAFWHAGVCVRIRSLTGIPLVPWHSSILSSILPGTISVPDRGPGVGLIPWKECTGPNNRP